MTTPWISDRIVDLVACLTADVEEIGAGPVCTVSALPGRDVVLDSCSDCGNSTCGMAYVKVKSAFHFEEFPAPSDYGKCNLPVAWELEIGVARCMPLTADGSMPESGEMLDTLLGLLDDEAAMRHTINCCLEGVEVAVAAYEPIGPLGGCVGGSIAFTITSG